MRLVIQTLAFITWIAGLVLAEGFWWTLGALLIPIVSWYLVIDAFILQYVK
jgi:hypothetical protein